MTRLASGGVLVGLAVLFALSLTQRAEATNGDPIVAGNYNTQTGHTFLYDTTLFPAAQGCNRLDAHDGFVACGQNGLIGRGVTNGIAGFSPNSTASGVYGENDGTGYGVAGRATNASGGTGVLGDAPNAANGVGVEADSASGTALRVKGKATFSTAGTAVIASGRKSVTVSLAGVTTTDFVLATVQGSGSFFVKNASAGSGQFTITINKAPTAPATVKVAYFVISAS